MWSAPDYAPVLMDHDPLGLSGVAENADAEPVEYAGVDTCDDANEREPRHSSPGQGTVGVVLGGETESAAWTTRWVGRTGEERLRTASSCVFVR